MVGLRPAETRRRPVLVEAAGLQLLLYAPNPPISCRSRIKTAELEEAISGNCAPSTRLRAGFAFRCELCSGEYTITAASDDSDRTAHDWIEDAVAVLRAEVRTEKP